jgi:alkanesulfonate monooxygenase SsuD/methylene tetrahydromethanopterin reductase-like flavin-dependent oxidoreductase (luciferase family)
VVGGESPAAHRRAVEQGHGWYGFALDPPTTAAQLEGLRQAAVRCDRPADLGELEISVTPPSTPDREMAERFAELGVHRLILRPPRDLDESGLADYLYAAAEGLVGRA